MMAIRRRILILTAVAIVGVCLAVTAAHAGLPNKCAAYKEKGVGKFAYDSLRCREKAERSGVDDPICYVVPTASIEHGFASVDSKLPCYTTNDVGTMEDITDAFVADVVQTLDPASPPPTINKCSVNKTQCVAKTVRYILKCYTNAVKKGFPVDPACTGKYYGKFDGGSDPSQSCFAKVEAKYPGQCLTTGDTADVESKIAAFANDVASKLEPLCGNNVIESPFETCDGTQDSACPGLCRPPGAPFACTCPFCGDGTINQGSEVCDKSDDGACPGHCAADCTCAVCGNNVTEPYVEDCDGTDDAECPGACGPVGAPNECRCPGCGNNAVDPGETCDGVADTACPGLCDNDVCQCTVCGDNVVEPPETCDGTSDSSCHGQCRPPGDPYQCRCPFCGDNSVNQFSEECDGTSDSACPGRCSVDCYCTYCGDGTIDAPFEQCEAGDDAACPGECLPPGDPNECRCPVCGDNAVNQASEQCDGTDDSACPGACLGDCTCP